MGAGLVGATLYLALFLLVAAQQFARYAHPAGLDLTIAGVSAREAVVVLRQALWPVIFVTNAVLLIFHAAAGFVLGLVAGRFWDAAARRAGRPPSSGRTAVCVAGSLLIVAALAFALVAVRYPYQYDHLLNARDGAPRRVHAFLTAHVRPEPVEVALWAVIAVLALPAVLGATRRRPLLAAVVGAVASVGAATWPRAAGAPGGNDGPNVVLILLESARPDYFSVNGYPRPTSPHLDRLVAEGGVTFTDAWAHANGTVASVVTLMTSTYAPRHGMRSMFHNEEFARPGLSTLPGVLRAHGFATRVVTDWDGDTTYFNERVLPGFDRYDVTEFGIVSYVKQTYAQHVVFLALTDNPLGHRAFATFYRAGGGFTPGGSDAYYRDRIAAHLAELARARRFFLTLFFADAHINYRCPFPYYARFTEPGYAGINKYQARSNPQAASGPDAEARQIAGLYAGCVSALDDNIGFVAATLRRLGLDRQTIVVVTGDHGERLPDPRSFRYGRHGAWLDPAEFRVPLVIVAPDLASARRTVSAPARHVDVMPTILDLAGVPAPPGLAGVSLVPLMTGAESNRLVDVFGETGFHWTPVRPPYLGYPSMTEVVQLRLDEHGALIPRYFIRPDCLPRIELARHRFVRAGRWQLNYRPTADGAIVELYDWTSDPDLQLNVAARHPPEVAALKARLLAWALASPDLVLRGGVLDARDAGGRDRCAPRG